MSDEELRKLRNYFSDKHPFYSKDQWAIDVIDEALARGAQRDEARAALAKAQKDAALTEAWLVERIDEELKREGLPALSWTDGGGSACPTGWHRNPYLNSGRVAALEAALAKAEQERDFIKATMAGQPDERDVVLRALAFEEAARRVETFDKAAAIAIRALGHLPPSLVAVDVGVLERATAEPPQDECSDPDAYDHVWDACDECQRGSAAYLDWNEDRAAALAELRALVRR